MSRRTERQLLPRFVPCNSSTFAAALEVTAKAEKGSIVLAMLPDTGERYLSTPLFEGVETGSDEL